MRATFLINISENFTTSIFDGANLITQIILTKFFDILPLNLTFYHATRTIFRYFASLNSTGVIPYFSLKSRWKVRIVVNPDCCATLSMVILESPLSSRK